MKKISTFGLIFLITISLQSCKPDDIYHDLSDDAKGFVNFEIGDTFKLKNTATNEIITFSIIAKNFRYLDDGPNGSSFISFGVAPADIYVQQGSYSFTNSSNCYQGEITVTANQEGGFSLIAFTNECFDNLGAAYGYDYMNVFLPTVDVAGIQYQNAYVLHSDSNVLYYSKEKGILKIVNELSNTTLFSHVE